MRLTRTILCRLLPAETDVTTESLEAFISRLEFWVLIFGVIAVIGAAGGSVFGVRIWWNNRKLHRLQVAQATAQRLKMVELQQEAAEAEAKAEGFRLEIARANERASEATRKAAQAALELAKYKSPRTLTDQQLRAITDQVRPFAGQEYEVITYWDDKEPMAISNRISRGLVRLASWRPEQPKRFEALLGGVKGILVYVDSKADEKTKRAAAVLASALERAGGLECRLESTHGSEYPNKIQIQVGTKH